MPTAIRLTEGGPFRYRDTNVSIGRGDGAVVDDDHAERLLDEHPFIVEACGVLMDSGDYCTRDAETCQYHADTSDDTDDTDDTDDASGDDDGGE